MKEVLVVDTGISNIKSLIGALRTLNVNYVVLENVLTGKAHLGRSLILPGIGNFSVGSTRIRKLGFYDYLHEIAQKEVQILGICLGMQLLCDSSLEAPGASGLGFFNVELEKFNAYKENTSSQHVGFNTVELSDSNFKLFNGLTNQNDFYFTHSFKLPRNQHGFELGYTNNLGETFTSVISNGTNVHGVQFHPEKSQSNGLKLLKNFLEL